VHLGAGSAEVFSVALKIIVMQKQVGNCINLALEQKARNGS